MQLQYPLTAADLQACQAHVASQCLQRKAGWRQRLWTIVAISSLWFLLAWMLHLASLKPELWQLWVLGGVVLLSCGSLVAIVLWRRGGRWKAWLAQFSGDYELFTSPSGISFSAQGYSSFFAWQHVLALEEIEHYWLLYLRPDVAAPIPKSALPEQVAASFPAEVRRLWGEYREHRGLHLPTQPHERAVAKRLWSALGANLLAGLRLACWRPVSPGDFRAGTNSLLFLILLQFAYSMLFAYLQAMPKPVFNPYGVTAFGTGMLLFLLGGAVVATMVVSRDSIPRLWVMLLASGVVVEISWLTASTTLYRLGASYPPWLLSAIFFLCLAWALLVVFRTVRLLYRQPIPSAWWMVSVFAFFVYAIPSYLPNSKFFYPDYGDQETAARMPKINVEDTFYRQSQLINQALSALQAQNPGKTDLYFLGFAGQADEKVFANEVHYARSLLERRFGAEGRALSLINSTDTVADTPLANAHNLKAALQGVASHMDRDEDVLFLFLTSHGAKDHSLSVSFWPLDLNDLKAEKLKEMLDNSGIRNRIIVVSACYSGGFLDVLKDDNTLILTASSRDHVSYGCGDATEYTYFGEAYFVKSLTRENSFITAFNKARGMIEAREKSEGKEASGPQIYVGKNIQRRLDSLTVN